MNISFGYGIHRTPTLGEDGELTECVNLIPEHGELVNIQPPKKIGITLNKDGEELFAIHETSSFKHYIVKEKSSSSCSLEYFSEGETERKSIASFSDIDINAAETIGNTLILLCDDGVYYYIWKEGSYISLGQRPPFLNMSFSLSPHYGVNDVSQVSITIDVGDLMVNSSVSTHVWGDLAPNGYSKFIMWGEADSDDDTRSMTEIQGAVRDKLTTSFTGIVDEAINIQKKKDRFTDTFFVRYAYRTYSGSMMVSPPVMMIPSNEDIPIRLQPLGDKDSTSKTGFIKFDADCMVFGHDLSYKIENADEIKSKLEDWKDVISGIDIFVSSQIPRYNQNGEFKGAAYPGYTFDTSAIRSFTNGLEYPDEDDLSYTFGKTSSQSSDESMDSAEYDSPHISFESSSIDYFKALGFRKKDSDYFKEIEETSIFYRFKYIETKDIKSYEVIKPDTGTLKTLESRETLSEQLYSNDTLIPTISFMYNKRLNIADITRKYHGFECPSLFAYTYNKFNMVSATGSDASFYKWKIPEIDTSSVTTRYDYELYLTILENGTTVVVKNPSGVKILESPHYLYYPNMHVTKGILVRTDESGNKEYAELTFDRHKMLSGSFWFDRFESITFTALTDPSVIPTGNDYIVEHNMIYTSETNNPFVFNTTNMAAVGQGNILGVSTANKALSGGTEFGANPLLCFCSDGIWPMSVSSDGTYSSVKPLTRDVVTNADAILQLDDAVAFITKRGLMVTDGSETGTGLISEVMHGKNIDETRLKGLVSTHDSLIIADTEDFVTMVQSCKMMFDYAHQLIHIYPANNIGKHFVYSITSKEFSSYAGSDADIVTTVPGYPLSTIQLTDGSLAQYETSTDFTTTRYGVLLTRPTALGNPYAMKNIADLRLSYSRNVDGTKCLIQPYVSNDRRTWFKMSSLRAHSYKWYRFAVFTTLCDIDGLEGLTLQENTVRNNKIR